MGLGRALRLPLGLSPRAISQRSDAHVWVADARTPDERQNWLDNLDRLEALAPQTVIPGHAPNDRPYDPDGIGFTRRYLQTFIRELKKKSGFCGSDRQDGRPLSESDSADLPGVQRADFEGPLPVGWRLARIASQPRRGDLTGGAAALGPCPTATSFWSW